MKTGGRIGGIAGLLLLLFVCGTHGLEEHLFLNGRSVGVDVRRDSECGNGTVPLLEMAPRLGIQVAQKDPLAWELRWSGGRRWLREDEVSNVEETPFVPLDWLVDLAGGTIRRVGGLVYVETRPSLLDSFDGAAEGIILRFDRFVPCEVLEAGAETIRLRLHHAMSDPAYRSLSFDDGPLTRAEVRSASGGLDVLLHVREIGELASRTLEVAGSYSVTLSVGAERSQESMTVVGDVRWVECDRHRSTGLLRFVYVRVEDWRSGHRVTLTPGGTFSSDGSPTATMGIARIPSLFVRDGAPTVLPEDPVHVLRIDTFGRLSDEVILPRAHWRVEGVTIPLDGINRPLGEGEVVAFTPGYAGSLAPTVRGPFAVAKLRAGRVVSVYDGELIDHDETATMIVAVGSSRDVIAGVEIGDEARLICLAASGSSTAAEAREPIHHAVDIVGMLLRDGRLPDQSIFIESQPGWTILAEDVLGGLILLTASASSGAEVEEVLALLGELPSPVVDAYVLCNHPASLRVGPLGNHWIGDESLEPFAILVQPLAR